MVPTENVRPMDAFNATRLHFIHFRLHLGSGQDQDTQDRVIFRHTIYTAVRWAHQLDREADSVAEGKYPRKSSLNSNIQ